MSEKKFIHAFTIEDNKVYIYFVTCIRTYSTKPLITTSHYVKQRHNNSFDPFNQNFMIDLRKQLYICTTYLICECCEH